MKGLIEACAKHCPGALLNIISNPVNSTVPIAAEVLRRAGVYDPRKVLGVTTLDVVRAKTFFAEKAGLDVSQVDVPVVGGHAGITILPLFSQATPAVAPSARLSVDALDALTKRTQDGGTEVVTAKAGKGSATLSMAYAAALFADACLRGLAGHVATECAYVESTVVSALGFFLLCCFAPACVFLPSPSLWRRLVLSPSQERTAARSLVRASPTPTKPHTSRPRHHQTHQPPTKTPPNTHKKPTKQKNPPKTHQNT